MPPLVREQTRNILKKHIVKTCNKNWIQNSAAPGQQGCAVKIPRVLFLILLSLVLLFLREMQSLKLIKLDCLSSLMAYQWRSSMAIRFIVGAFTLRNEKWNAIWWQEESHWQKILPNYKHGIYIKFILLYHNYVLHISLKYFLLSASAYASGFSPKLSDTAKKLNAIKNFIRQIFSH